MKLHRRKVLYVVSLLALVLTLVLLATTTFAWFAFILPHTEGFEVSVKGADDFSFRFLKWNGVAYVPVSPEEAVSLDAKDELIPGKSIKYRIEVFDSTTNGKLSVSFTNVVKTPDSPAFDSYLYVNLTAPIATDRLMFSPDWFRNGTFRLCEGIDIVAGETMTVDYEYFLGEDANTASEMLVIHVGGILFSIL